MNADPSGGAIAKPERARQNRTGELLRQLMKHFFHENTGQAASWHLPEEISGGAVASHAFLLLTVYVNVLDCIGFCCTLPLH